MIASGLLALWLSAPSDGPSDSPASYSVARTSAAREVLLRGDEAAWSGAAAISWGPAGHTTTFRAQWNDDGLIVRWDAVDPNPWHTLTERDAHIYKEEVVEIYIDLDRSGTHYAEIDINPAGTVCDVHVLRPLPMKDGDPPWKGDFSWNLDGIEARATIDRQGEVVRGWTAIAWLPWRGFASLPSATVPLPPKAGDRWRFNVFRIERPHGADDPEREVVLAAWSPTGIPKFHVASAFRDLVFVR